MCDTSLQIAHLVIRELEGQKLPERLTLFDICQCYSGTGNNYGWRTDVKVTWWKHAMTEYQQVKSCIIKGRFFFYIWRTCTYEESGTTGHSDLWRVRCWSSPLMTSCLSYQKYTEDSPSKIIVLFMGGFFFYLAGNIFNCVNRFCSYFITDFSKSTDYCQNSKLVWKKKYW